jgi:hypothetical protein
MERQIGVDYITTYINYDYNEPIEESLSYINNILDQIYGNKEDKKAFTLWSNINCSCNLLS